MSGGHFDYNQHRVREIAEDIERLIPITKRLRAILKGHPATGPVTPTAWRRKYEAQRVKASITGKADITRHTFASCFLAIHGEEKTKAALGHEQQSRTLFRHYRKAMSKADARQIMT